MQKLQRTSYPPVVKVLTRGFFVWIAAMAMWVTSSTVRRFASSVRRGHNTRRVGITLQNRAHFMTSFKRDNEMRARTLHQQPKPSIFSAFWRRSPPSPNI